MSHVASPVGVKTLKDVDAVLTRQLDNEFDQRLLIAATKMTVTSSIPDFMQQHVDEKSAAKTVLDSSRSWVGNRRHDRASLRHGCG